jgi:hypothetical protein
MKNSVLNQFEQSLFEALLNGDRVRPSQQIIIAVSGGKAEHDHRLKVLQIMIVQTG